MGRGLLFLVRTPNVPSVVVFDKSCAAIDSNVTVDGEALCRSLSSSLHNNIALTTCYSRETDNPLLQPSELLRAAFFLVQGDEVVGDGVDGESGEGVYL